jgi:transcriptional regulator with XRE-family HTH domain
VSENDVNAEREQHMRQFDAGQHLKNLRGDRSLNEIASVMGVSKGYLSEVERGIRLPSDHFLTRIAEEYGADPEDIFYRFGKMPILSFNVIAQNKMLRKTITDIGKRKGLTDEQRERLCDSIYRAYKEALDEIHAEKDKEE